MSDKQAAEPPAPEITYDDFRRVDIRVGTIVAAEPFPEARRPSVKLSVDFGPDIGLRRSAAQIVKHYRIEHLVGRQVAAVVNFPHKQIGKFMSEVLVLGFPDGEGDVVMIGPDKPVPNGGRLF
jgi:tRNA-binding protein